MARAEAVNPTAAKGRKAKPKPVDDRISAFIQIYMADPERNGTRAAIAAGYSPRSAAVTASRLLKRANISAKVAAFDAKVGIAEAQVVQRVIDRTSLTKERAMTLLAIMASADIRDIMSFGPQHREITMKATGEVIMTAGVSIRPSDEISDEAALCIQEVSEGQHGIKVKLYDRRAAIMDFAKLAGWITEKREHEIPALTAFLAQVQQAAQRSALPVGPRVIPAPAKENPDG